MKRFPTKVKGSRLDGHRECVVTEGPLPTARTAKTNTIRSCRLPSFTKWCQPLPRVLTRWQIRAGSRERSESVPCSQGRAPSPLSDDCHPLLRLLCQVPELVVGDNDPVGLFSQLHHEPVSKTTAAILGFNKVPTPEHFIDAHDALLVMEIWPLTLNQPPDD